MEKPYSRKQGDTYPVRSQIRDSAGLVDLSNANAITLRLARKETRSSTPEVVDTIAGAKVVGAPTWAIFEDVDDIAALTPALYDYEISYEIGGKITTTKTDTIEILRQLG